MALPPEDFRERSTLGAIPGADLQDWPITYDELEPYYTKAEWELGVSGLAGANPFDGPRSKPFPLPPMPVKSSGVIFERGAKNSACTHFRHPSPFCRNHIEDAPHAPIAAAAKPSDAR